MGLQGEQQEAQVQAQVQAPKQATATKGSPEEHHWAHQSLTATTSPRAAESNEHFNNQATPPHMHSAICVMKSNMMNACGRECRAASSRSCICTTSHDVMAPIIPISDDPTRAGIVGRMQINTRLLDECTALVPAEAAVSSDSFARRLQQKQMRRQHCLSVSLLGIVGLLMWVMVLVSPLISPIRKPPPSPIQADIVSPPEEMISKPLKSISSPVDEGLLKPAPPSTRLRLYALVPVPASVQLGVPGKVPKAVEAEPSSEQWKPLFSPELEEFFDIYCRGPLLHTIQSANIFPDSKHFVDMPIKRNSSAVQLLRVFREQKLAFDEFQGGNLASYRATIRKFLASHFDKPGSDLVPITPLDFQEHSLPPKILKIQDPVYREWAFSLHQLWKTLGRVPDTSKKGSFLHNRAATDKSLTRPENVLIVPGGRFRESYYWDSYWIVHGLLVSDMALTARGVVNNLLEYVQKFGFVPNGSRIYYLTRSQPPMLSEMVRLVAKQGHLANRIEFDVNYLKTAVPILEKEYAFWMQRGPGGHAVEISMRNATTGQVETHVLNRFVSMANHPRPESYREDVSVASLIVADSGVGKNSAEAQALKDKYYNEVIAAAESGWDFSSRWLREKSDMRTMDTSNVVPVDLNSVLYRMELNLMTFHECLGHPRRARAFEEAAQRRARAMDAILWSERHQSWKDFLLRSRTHSPIVSISDFRPLWAKAFNRSDQVRNQKILEALVKSGLVDQGGVQTTTVYTGQQWDSPNAWPPEQDLLIEGLLNMNTKQSHELASRLAKSWVKASLSAWDKTGLMFEKYNASESGMLGVGGEYFPQFGFGWTNGVILKVLTVHQNLLVEDDETFP